MSGPTARHFELHRLMLATAWPGKGGRPICVHGQAKLADRLGVDARTIRRLISDLREPGIDPRHPHVKPTGLRLGWLLVLPRERPGGRGGTLYGANRYVLQLDPDQLDDLEAQSCSSRSDRRDTARPPSYPQGDPPESRFPRSDRRDKPSPESNRRDTPDPLVLAGQIEGTGEPVSLSHVLQGGRDTHPGCDDRAPLRSAASGSAARSAGEKQGPPQERQGGPGPVDWRAALGNLTPPDDGEWFASRDEEEQEKRRRAEQLLARPDLPCLDCPEEGAG